MSGVDRYEWERVMRRARLGSSTKYVGMTLAQYANRDGTSIRPGVARLVAVTELSERTVRGALTKLRELGLIERVREGSSLGRRAITDEYRLAIPADVLDRIPMLDPDESPATAAGDRANYKPEHRQLLHPSPAAAAGTPATGAGITGSSCTPPTHDQPTTNPVTNVRLGSGTGLTTARGVEEHHNVIPLIGRAR